MILAGLDFSINYPAITILKNNEYIFISFMREGLNKNILNFNSHLNINIFKDKIETARDKIIDSNRLTEGIMKILIEHKVEKIFIENFSYQSMGFQKEDLVGYQYILRSDLIKNNIDFEVFSPKTIKKVAGSGNFGKKEMYEAFLNENFDSNFLEFVKNNKNKVVKESKLGKITIVKPFEDLIDSYFVLKTGILNLL